MPIVNLPGEPETVVGDDIIERLLPEWWGKFVKKNSAYGDKLAAGDDLGIKAFIPEMNRKMQGIKNVIWHELPQDGGEGPREKAMDLVGHLLIFISNLDALESKAQAKSNANRHDKELGALGWPIPMPVTYQELQERGRALLASPHWVKVTQNPPGAHIFPRWGPLPHAVRLINEELPRDPNNYQGTYYEEPAGLLRPDTYEDQIESD